MSTSFANKFAVLSDSKKSKLASSVDTPKNTQKKPASPKPVAPKAPAAAKPATVAAKSEKAPAKAATPAATSDAPTDLRAAAEYNRKKAEELAERRAAEEAKKAEAKAAKEAKKKADEEAAAAAAAEAAAKGETTEAPAEGAEASGEGADAKVFVRKPKPVEEEPAVEVFTMDAYNKQRAESKFVVGQKAARKVDTKAFDSLQKIGGADEQMVVPKKTEAKPAAKPAGKAAAKNAKPVSAPVRHEKKEKSSEKIDLSQFGAPQQAGRGRGLPFSAVRGGGFVGQGRGGYQSGNRVPNMEDKRAFPTLA